MKELGIKDGKWITRINNFGIDVIEEKSGFGIICLGTTRQLKDAEYPISMAKSHAILCADAGNTAQKCGLLPSELLKQRDELREENEKLKDMLRSHNPFPNRPNPKDVNPYDIGSVKRARRGR